MALPREQIYKHTFLRNCWWNEFDKRAVSHIDVEYYTGFKSLLQINSNVILTGGLVRYNEINQLTVDEALDIAKKSRDVRKFLNKNHVLDIQLHTVRNLQAELIIVAESNTKTEKDTVRGDRVKNKNL